LFPSWTSAFGHLSDILAGTVGSPAIAAWIAEAAFWCLLVYGLATGELNLKRIAIFLLTWLAGHIGLPYVSYEPIRAMFSSFVAALVIALVFMIFEGDVRLTRRTQVTPRLSVMRWRDSVRARNGRPSEAHRMTPASTHTVNNRATTVCSCGGRLLIMATWAIPRDIPKS
jgi:hypothetical protein